MILYHLSSLCLLRLFGSLKCGLRFALFIDLL
jgi:hypothetical protein